MNSIYVALIFLTGFFASYFIWTSQSVVEIPRERVVYEQVDKRKLRNFLSLVESIGSKHKGQDEVEDSLSTIMSASKKLTTKTEILSHSKNITSPFPWTIMLSLWGTLGGVAFLLLRKSHKQISLEDSISDNKQKSSRYFTSEKLIGDLNQSVVSMNRRLELQAQNLDRYIDLELKEDLSDCFVEKKRLERLVGNFLDAAFNLVKSDDQSRGMVVQTNENEGRYKLVCFLDNFDQNHLSSQQLPDLLRHFSVLEKQFSGCRPTIDFHYVELKNHQGLEIELSFENTSELETGLNSRVQV